MPESLALPDGETLTAAELNAKFNEAMAAPEPDEEVAPAPKRRAPREQQANKPAHAKPRVSDSTGTAPKRPGRPAKATEAAKAKDYTAELEGLLQLSYGVTAATGNLADAGAIKTHGPGMAAAWNAAAQENATVRKGIEWLTKGGVWGAVLMSTMPFALQVAANHGQVPVEKVAALGVKDPQSLATETEKDIQEMARMAEQQMAAAA